MSVTLNKVLLIGNVGKDPDIRITGYKKDSSRSHHSQTTQEKVSIPQKEVASFVLVTAESWFDKSANVKKEKKEWHRVVVFVPHLVEMVKKNVRKGMKLFIEGSLQTRPWRDNRDDVEKYTTEILLQHNTNVIVILDDKHDVSHDSHDAE